MQNKFILHIQNVTVYPDNVWSHIQSQVCAAAMEGDECVAECSSTLYRAVAPVAASAGFLFVSTAKGRHAGTLNLTLTLTVGAQNTVALLATNFPNIGELAPPERCQKQKLNAKFAKLGPRIVVYLWTRWVA